MGNDGPVLRRAARRAARHALRQCGCSGGICRAAHLETVMETAGMEGRHMLVRCMGWMCALVLCVAHVVGAGAQGYPDKPVRLVTAAAGAGGDFVARIAASRTH